jgi:HAMP domain-containing protein
MPDRSPPNRAFFCLFYGQVFADTSVVMGLLKRDSKRKIAGLIVDSRALLRLSIPFFVLLLSNLVIFLIVSRQMSRALEGAMDSNPGAIAVMAPLMWTVLSTLMWGMCVLGLFSMILWVIYSHRIFGPVVPIRRHLARLIAGNYDEKMTLRKNDEFKEIARDLNRLAEVLKSSRRS